MERFGAPLCYLRPDATGAFRGRIPQITACAPQTKNVPPQRGLYPKESKRLGATGVQFGLKHPLNTVLFVSKNRFFGDFFFWCSLSNSREKCFVPYKNLFMPSPVTLLWRRTCITSSSSHFFNKTNFEQYPFKNGFSSTLERRFFVSTNQPDCFRIGS